MLRGMADLARLEVTGSGPMERTVYVPVIRRYKKRGMTWRRRGSNALLRPRLMKANGEWEEYRAPRREAFARRGG